MAIITALTPADIMIGKLVSIFLFIGVLVASSVPISVVTFQFGDVSWSELLKNDGILLLAGLYYVGCGIGASGMCEKTSSAVMVTYGLIASLYFVSTVLPTFFWLFMAITHSTGQQKWVAYFPWVVLTIKVTAGIGLLSFGWYKVNTFEQVG